MGLEGSLVCLELEVLGVIKTVSLAGLQHGKRNSIPAGSIVLCPKCLRPRCIVTEDIRPNGNGGLEGASGDLVYGKTPFLPSASRYCPECGTNILWDGHPVGAGNCPYPSRRFQGTYIEPDTFISYVVGYLMIASQDDDLNGKAWQHWARKDPAVAQG